MVFLVLWVLLVPAVAVIATLGLPVTRPSDELSHRRTGGLGRPVPVRRAGQVRRC